MITSLDAGVPIGLAVGSFSSVSLRPPLVGFFVDESSTTWPRIAGGGHFVANVLSGEQEALCRQFAVSGGDKFAGVEWWVGARTGAPVLVGCCLTVECEIDSVAPAGDHSLVLGRVLELQYDPEASPLIFLKGGYCLPQPTRPLP